MIAELSAAMAAIKETAGLAKVINDAKTDAEVKAATIELQNKLITLQAECFSLGDVIRLRDEEAALLKAKIADFEDFKSQADGFLLNQLESGTLVYSKIQTVGDAEITVHLCPNCYANRKLSILQPTNTSWAERFYRSICPLCKTDLKMDKKPLPSDPNRTMGI